MSKDSILKHGGTQGAGRSPLLNLVVPDWMLADILELARKEYISKGEAARRLIAKGLGK